MTPSSAVHDPTLWPALVADLAALLQPAQPSAETPPAPALDDLGSIWQALRQLAESWGKGPEGERLIFKWQQRLAFVASQSLSEAPVPVLCLLADDQSWQPLNSPWLQEVLEMAGGSPLNGADLPTVLPPDTRLICFGSLEQPPALAAAQRFRVPAGAGLLLPGSRLPELLELLAEMLQPELFDFGQQGCGWQNWP
jgi:ABC-type Fe3+-hydroxamate transport system substrate-binding protein